MPKTPVPSRKRGISSLIEAAERRQVLVLYCRLPLTGALSCMDSQGRCSIGIDPCQLTGETDERLKLAHELGHCATGAFYNRYSPLDSRERHELRARRWALEALVPESSLRAAIKARLLPHEMQELFGVDEETIRLALQRHRELLEQEGARDPED